MKKVTLCGIALCSILHSNCKKLIQVKAPDNTVTSTDIFSSDSLSQAAMTGLYVNVMGKSKYLLNGGVTLYTSLSSDELLKTVFDKNENPFLSNSIATDNPLNNEALWNAAYSYIYTTNICIEGFRRTTTLSTDLKKRLLGEAMFMRALCYYYLVNLYGNLPLAVQSNAETNSLLSRSEVSTVNSQIVKDLLGSDSLLSTATANVYPSSMACKALLAQVYLQQSDWEKAATAASDVINSGRYTLETELNRVFLSNSRETIFQLAPVLTGINTVEGTIFVPPSTNDIPGYQLQPSLVNSFEGGDLRKANWVAQNTISGNTYYYPYKYRNRSADGSFSEYNILLRLAQQYLIRAEARLHLADRAGCLMDLNTIRKRAGLSELPSTVTEPELMKAIEQENKVEFFAESGHRWFDLKRWGKALVVITPIKSGITSTGLLYPIPLRELMLNPNLKQNPGYN